MIMGGLGFSLAYFEDMALIGSNSGTKVYALAYEQGWLEWPKRSKNGLYHLLSAVLPMISPQPIFKPVLGLLITISEFPDNFPKFHQNFESVVTWVCYFLQGLSLFTSLITLVYSSLAL